MNEHRRRLPDMWRQIGVDADGWPVLGDELGNTVEEIQRSDAAMYGQVHSIPRLPVRRWRDADGWPCDDEWEFVT